MRTICRNAIWGMVVGLLILHANRAMAGDHDLQKACELSRATFSIQYLLYLPKGYERKPSWPLLLFLHGAGGRGDDLDKVRKIGVAKVIEAGRDFPFVVVSPQCSMSRRRWEPITLTILLDEIVKKYKIDQDRIYVTGQSMGGFGTWALAAHSPGRFAAIVPICGGGDPAWAERLAGIPTWVFHGAKDPTVPLTMSQEMVDALKKSGGNVKFTVYPEAKHDAWTQTYANPQVFEWLLQQKRTTKKPDNSNK